MKIGRNTLCPCGSGKKYKRCHLGETLLPTKMIKTNPETPIEQKYKALFSYNRELRGVVDTIMDKEYPLGGDKEVFTAFCVGKAYKTHGALLLLCEQGYGQDAAILVRSLIDLLITLLYILEDSTNKRIQRYFAYDWILRKKMFDYGKTKPEILKLLEARNANPKSKDNTLKEIEEQAKLAQEKYKYGRDWSDKNIREMAEFVDKKDLYLTIYRLQSQLMHTAPRTMNEYIKDNGKGYTIEVGQNDRWVEDTLVVAFDCMYNIVGQYDKLLHLGYAKQLDDIAKRYLQEVDNLNNKT